MRPLQRKNLPAEHAGLEDCGNIISLGIILLGLGHVVLGAGYYYNATT